MRQPNTARLISEQTRYALSAAKLRSEILGVNGRNLAAKNRKSADEFAATLRTRLDADLMRQSYSEIARHLNSAGVTTVIEAGSTRVGDGFCRLPPLQ